MYSLYFFRCYQHSQIHLNTPLIQQECTQLRRWIHLRRQIHHFSSLPEKWKSAWTVKECLWQFGRLYFSQPEKENFLFQVKKDTYVRTKGKKNRSLMVRMYVAFLTQMKIFWVEQASFFPYDRQGRTYIPQEVVCALCEAFLKKLVIRFSNSAESKHMTCCHTPPFLLPALFVKSWVASNDFVDTQSLFCELCFLQLRWQQA